MAQLLDGKALAERLRAPLRARAAAVAARLGRPPTLALVGCGEPASAQVYFGREKRAAADTGLGVVETHVDPGAGERALVARLQALSADAAVDAVLLAMPLPPGFDAGRVLEGLGPSKDVEGLTLANAGRLYGSKTMDEVRAHRAFIPCTALAVLRLLEASGAAVAGARAVVIGRSSVVGRPTAHLLSCLDATVTLAHSKTAGLDALCREADVLVAAAGRPGLVTGDMVKPGAVVIDAGATVRAGRVAGDVDFESASAKAGWITPVPGGVGPVTAAELLAAVVGAAEAASPA